MAESQDLPEIYREEISAADRATFVAISSFTGAPKLTSQQEQFVMLHMRGLSPTAAARAAGYKHPERAGPGLLRTKSVQQAIELVSEKAFGDMRVTREQLTIDLYNAHSHAANASEEVMALREIGKLHGLYAPQEKKISMDADIKVTNTKQIERLTDEQLIKQLGEEIVLDPDDYHTIDDSR